MNNLEKARKCFDKAVGLEIFGNYGEACDVYREGQTHYEKHIEQEGKRKDRWKRWAKQAWGWVKLGKYTDESERVYVVAKQRESYSIR